MKKIIVPVDFSETSAAALRFGTYLAEVMDYDLTVVHVFDPNFSLAQVVSTGALLAEQERLRQELQAFVQRHAYPVLATFQGSMATLPAITTQVHQGIPAKVVNEMSTRADVELMVLGGIGAGRGGTPPGLFGGVASRLALHGKCPVILIPPSYGYPAVDTLALAFKDIEDIHQMSGLVRELLKVLRPRVNLVHVERPDDDKNLLKDDSFLETIQGPDFPGHVFCYHALPAGSVVKRLMKYVDKRQIGMLVLGGQRRSFWQGLFSGRSLRPIVNRCEVPLLIIPLSAPE
ncbi:MAG: universal stress protein [Bacteroidota bacterium]